MASSTTFTQSDSEREAVLEVKLAHHVGIREDADHVGSPLQVAVEPLLRIV
jgi:hypothetical protein